MEVVHGFICWEREAALSVSAINGGWSERFTREPYKKFNFIAGSDRLRTRSRSVY